LRGQFHELVEQGGGHEEDIEGGGLGRGTGLSEIARRIDGGVLSGPPGQITTLQNR
jgi:hypothetical protein